MLLGDLGDFEQADRALLVDDGTTLDVSLGLVGQLHDVLGVGLHHVLEDAEIDNGAEVVNIGQEDDLNAALKELVENARVVERLENITVARRVPLVDGGVEALRNGEERVLENTGVAGLVEGEDIDIVALVLLDDGSGIVVGVEGVHEDEGDVDVVCAVEVLNLANRQVEERHAVTDLDDGLGTDATHGGTKTAIELEDGKFAKELSGLGVGEIFVVDNLARGRRVDAVPVTKTGQVSTCQKGHMSLSGNTRNIHSVALGLVVEVSAEEGEEVVHFSLEELT